ncbi:hypothetical protein TIFTF001_047376 [Ficus carica]|uniref:GST N-terminal domain-containing protein n=1 Tax=Ficus carica TaxID=3494 RepID=A0AA88CMD3_FICCA|nr:hypothetical protein TIFTF001_047376 [Ficus carica]
MSSCAFRVRIALNLKGLNYEYVPVNLLKGEQRSSEFLKLNPLGYVPVLVDGDVVLADSLAILLCLDEKYPQHPLLPSDLRRKALNLQSVDQRVFSTIHESPRLRVCVDTRVMNPSDQ